jgi:hypothetical protein
VEPGGVRLSRRTGEPAKTGDTCVTQEVSYMPEYFGSALFAVLPLVSYPASCLPITRVLLAAWILSIRYETAT